MQDSSDTKSDECLCVAVRLFGGGAPVAVLREGLNALVKLAVNLNG
jgi:hypothetical protein